MPKASIIVPMYNSEKTIKKCVDSLIHQSEPDIEILLIDDGSTDNTLAVCRKLEAADRRIKAIHKNNGGVSSARNLGITSAVGDYLLFCDSDDSVETDWCKKLLENSSEDILSLCGYVKSINDRIVGEFKVKSVDQFIDSKDFLNIGYGILLGSVWNKCFSRKTITTNTLRFDESTSFEEDVIFVLNYLQKCKRIFLINDCLYRYCDTENSLIKQTKNIGEDFILSVYNLSKETIIHLGGDFSRYKKIHYKALFGSLEQRIKNIESARKIIRNKEFQKSIKYADRDVYDYKYCLLLRLKLTRIVCKMKGLS